MINKKHILTILISLILLFAIVSAIDSASATKYKKIDYKKTKLDKSSIITETAYISKNKKIVTVKSNLYIKKSEKQKYRLETTSRTYIEKFSKTKLKITTKGKYRGSKGVYAYTQYLKTKKSPKTFYLKYIKNEYENGYYGYSYGYGHVNINKTNLRIRS